jgi:hypothetical protein
MGTTDGRIVRLFFVDLHCKSMAYFFTMADALIAVADLKSLNREALEAIIAQQQLQLVTEQQARINSDSEIEHLKLVIAKLQRMIFGK